MAREPEKDLECALIAVNTRGIWQQLRTRQQFPHGAGGTDGPSSRLTRHFVAGLTGPRQPTASRRCQGRRPGSKRTIDGTAKTRFIVYSDIEN